jgi:hypothetical protein
MKMACPQVQLEIASHLADPPPQADEAASSSSAIVIPPGRKRPMAQPTLIQMFKKSKDS